MDTKKGVYLGFNQMSGQLPSCCECRVQEAQKEWEWLGMNGRWEWINRNECVLDGNQAGWIEMHEDAFNITNSWVSTKEPTGGHQSSSVLLEGIVKGVLRHYTNNLLSLHLLASNTNRFVSLKLHL